jgi:hypothetical protein
MKRKAASRKVSATPATLLKMSLGVFFILLGLMGVLPTVEESVFTLTNSYLYLEVIFGIVEIACGVFIISSLLTFFTKKIKYTMSVLIFVFWAARIILSKIVWGFAITASGIQFTPNFGTWLLILSCELIIAACLWINVKAYEA